MNSKVTILSTEEWACTLHAVPRAIPISDLQGLRHNKVTGRLYSSNPVHESRDQTICNYGILPPGSLIPSNLSHTRRSNSDVGKPASHCCRSTSQSAMSVQVLV
jgi:hypothetical protein